MEKKKVTQTGRKEESDKKENSKFCQEFCQKVDDKYRQIFELVGLNIDEFMTFPAISQK